MSYQPVHGGGGGGGGGGADAGYGGNQYRDDPNDNFRSNEYPMSSNNPYATTGSQPREYGQKKKSSRKLWWIIGAIVAICIIIGAVLGGVLGTRNKSSSGGSKDAANSDGSTNKDDSTTTGGSGDSKTNTAGSGSSTNAATATDKSGRPTSLPSLLAFADGTTPDKDYRIGSNGNVYLAMATDVNKLPVYATGTASSGYAAPAINTSPATNGAWPSDPDSPSSGSPRAHPRLYAPAYKWTALTSGLIAADPYLTFWNNSIVNNASATLNDPPIGFEMDGGNGLLDAARGIKLKVKNWAYAHKITGNTAYGDRIMKELVQATNGNGNWAGGSATGDLWNCEGHFLDCAEFINAYAIAYDWLYDFWTTEQRTQIRNWIITYGLNFGLTAYTTGTGGWWSGVKPGTGNQVINGNWNCVCNAGLLAGSLAVVDEDTTGVAKNLIDNYLIEGSKANCYQGAYSDGTWAETSDYWYFGTTGAAEIASAYQTAYGGDLGLDSNNAGWKYTSLFHMYVTGMTAKFQYGDHGPPKFSSTANGLFMWANLFNEPRYALYQRDQNDAAEPFSMFWYNPAVQGAWWNGLAIDKDFDSSNGHWSTARSSWSDNTGTYWAMKGSPLQNHQTHGDLDVGDFVLDAMGIRWATDLGSDQYKGCEYFNSEAQDAARWNYYRKRTEGQNTIVVGGANQIVTAAPVVKFDSSGTTQGSDPSLSVGTDDTAYMTIDMSSAYAQGTFNRGIRFLNGRQQVLVQDEITGAASSEIQWRMNTNATVSIDSAGTTATLTQKSQTGSDITMIVKLLNAEPSGLKFSTQDAVSASGDPSLVTTCTPASDFVNVEVPNSDSSTGWKTTVLTIANAAGGSMHTEVLFNPQWSGKSDSDFVTPKSVAIASWSLTSHN